MTQLLGRRLNAPPPLRERLLAVADRALQLTLCCVGVAGAALVAVAWLGFMFLDFAFFVMRGGYDPQDR